MNDSLPVSLVQFGTELEAAVTREIAATRRRGALPLRFARWGVACGCAIAALVLALGFTLSGNGNDDSLLARAYAAINPEGAVIHFVATVHRTPDVGGVTVTDDVWLSGKRSRAVVSVYRPHGPSSLRFIRRVIAVDGDHGTAIASYGTIKHFSTRDQCAPLVGFCNGSVGNPLAAVSDLYRTGSLHTAGSVDVNDRRLDVITGTISDGVGRKVTIRLLVTPRRSIPVEVVEEFSSGSVLTAHITDYQRLPLTARTKGLLTLDADQTR